MIKMAANYQGGNKSGYRGGVSQTPKALHRGNQSH